LRFRDKENAYFAKNGTNILIHLLTTDEKTVKIIDNPGGSVVLYTKEYM